MNDLKNIINTWLEIGGVLNYESGLYLMDESDFMILYNEAKKESNISKDDFAKEMTKEALSKINMPEDLIQLCINWDCISDDLEEKINNWLTDK